MEIINKLSRFFAPVEEEVIIEGEGFLEEEVVAQTAAAVETKKVVGGEPISAMPKQNSFVQKPKMTLVANNAKAQEMCIKIYTPQTFDNVSEIADALKAKRSAIVNYERVELAEQRRICDFLNGVCYVQDGEVRRITATMVLYVPDGVEISEAKTLAPTPAQI